MSTSSIYALLLLVLLSACSDPQPDGYGNSEELSNSEEDNMVVSNQMATGQMEQLAWLEGFWMSDPLEGGLREQWTVKSDQLMLGKGFTMEKGDTTFFENLRIFRERNAIYYGASVPTQNNGRMVMFELTSSGNQKFVFENPEHDFPQKIIYTPVTTDSFTADVGQGQPNGFTLHFHRVDTFPISVAPDESLAQ